DKQSFIFAQSGEDKLRTLMNKLLKISILIVFLSLPAIAQQSSSTSSAITAADYARAEKWMGYNTNPMVFHAGARPSWQGDERFWYRVTTAEGTEFVMVNSASGTKSPAFDHAKLAAALSTAAGTAYDAHHLPFTDFEVSADGQTISFTVQRRRWKCDLTTGKCTAEGTATAAGQGGGRGGCGNSLLSPEKKRAAFILDYNILVCGGATCIETQLINTGGQGFVYC